MGQKGWGGGGLHEKEDGLSAVHCSSLALTIFQTKRFEERLFLYFLHEWLPGFV
jgi:hypothetical protein